MVLNQFEVLDPLENLLNAVNPLLKHIFWSFLDPPESCLCTPSNCSSEVFTTPKKLLQTYLHSESSLFHICPLSCDSLT